MPARIDPAAGRRCEAQRYSPRPLTEGERWTADELAALRADRYRPWAWRRFLRHSLERSRASARVDPQRGRQARRWGVLGAIAWLAACRATRRCPSVKPSAAGGLAWWLAVWRMLDWHLGMAEGGDGRPHASLSPADAVTLARFWLVPAVPALRRSAVGLPGVIVLAGVSDWLDGALARHHGRTRLGRDLDTTADLAFIATATMTARTAGRITPLAFTLFNVRLLFGLVLSVGAVFARARRPAIRARPWGAAPRIAGLAMCTAGMRRSGTVVLLVGCLVPPRSTAPHLSRA